MTHRGRVLEHLVLLAEVLVELEDRGHIAAPKEKEGRAIQYEGQIGRDMNRWKRKGMFETPARGWFDYER